MTDDPARRLASELARRGLGAPGRLLADAHRPLGPLLSDLGAALGPLLRAAGGTRADGTVRLMEDPLALDRMVEALDTEMERRGQPR
jgi:hypothetical protein